MPGEVNGPVASAAVHGTSKFFGCSVTEWWDSAEYDRGVGCVVAGVTEVGPSNSDDDCITILVHGVIFGVVLDRNFIWWNFGSLAAFFVREAGRPSALFFIYYARHFSTNPRVPCQVGIRKHGIVVAGWVSDVKDR